MLKNQLVLKLFLVGAASLIWGSPAFSASVDLTVNTATSKRIYNYSERIQHTVTVANRGPGLATNAVLTIVSPQSAQTTAGWNAEVSCTASGGAVCPAGYALNAPQDTLTATIPSIPMGGELKLSMPAPIYVNRYQIGPLFEYATSTATVVAGSADTELVPITNTAGANYRVNKPRVDYSVSATGPTVAAIPGTNHHKVTYQVTVHNNEERNSLLTNFTWYEDNGSGVWDPNVNGYFAHPYQAGYFGLGLIPATEVKCVGSTGGATCANATDVDPNPAYSMYSPDMPSGSSLTFEVSRIVGLPRCIEGTDTGYRSVRLVLIQTGPNLDSSRTPMGLTENTGTTSDNRASVPPANITAPRCLNGDLMVDSIVANGGTSATPYQANQAFDITVTYSNAGAATATNAGLSFSLDLSLYSLNLLTLDLSQTTCRETGGAFCPSPDAWTRNGTDPIYRNQLNAFAPLMPANSKLEVTFRGTIGPNTDQICRLQYLTANAKITPPADYNDSNYYPNRQPTYSTGNQTQGNNAYQIKPLVDLGIDCPGLNYDVETKKSGPYSDSAATQLINSPVKPGEWIYFRTTYTVLPGGVPVKNYYFSDKLEYFDYPIDKNLFDYQSHLYISGNKYPIGPYSQVISADDPKMMTGRHFDPAGLPTTPKYTDQPHYLPSYDSGVRCVTATGGITCPSSVAMRYEGVVPTNPPVRAENAHGWYLNSGNWDAGQTVWNQGGKVELIYAYRVPPLDPAVTCLRSGQTAAKSYGLNVTDESTQSLVNGVGERNYDNNWDAVRFEVDPGLKPCPSGTPPTLTKTASASTMPLDGKVTYTVKLSNTSPQAIDVPRLRDTLSTAGIDQGVVATIDRCQPANDAACPGYTPLQGFRYTDNGATSTATTRDDSHIFGATRQRPDFDFSWGTPGSNTLPSGSSVTFTITVQYPVSVTASTNLATATPDYSAQKVFSRLDATASVSSPPQPPVLVNKDVSPQQAAPGSTVTYTVDLVNPHTAAANGLYFSDVLVPGMQAANPAGYANLRCTPLTAADALLPAPVGAATCPQFASDATGITARLDLPANAGLRLSYTAISPTPGGYSFDNTAVLRYSLTSRTSGDSGAQANFGAPPLLPDLTSDIADIPNADNTVAGRTVTVSVTYNNIGVGDGQDVVPTLQLPPGLTQVVPSHGGIYDPTTGLIAWPTISTFAPNAPVTYTASFTMPAATVQMRSYITGSNEPDTVLANNPDTARLGNATPQPIPTLSEWSLMALSWLLLCMASRQRRR